MNKLINNLMVWEVINKKTGCGFSIIFDFNKKEIRFYRLINWGLRLVNKVKK